METRPGRPPKDKTGAKQERLEFRVEKSEKEAMEAAAKTAELPLSEWARGVLLRAAKRTTHAN